MFLYFILGLLLQEVVLPIISVCTELVLTIVETGKGFFAVKCAKYNQQIAKLTGKNPEEKKKNPIGFLTSAIGEEIDSEPEEDDEEEFEDE